MRIRPPSVGFGYLALSVTVFISFFAYLQATPWFADSGRNFDLGQAAYLRRIAERGTDAQKARWLVDALRNLTKHRQWQDAMNVVLDCEREAIPPAAAGLTEIEAGRCWAVGLNADGSNEGGDPIVFLLHNPDDAPRRATFHWSAARLRRGRVRTVGGEWALFELEGAAVLRGAVTRVVPSRANLILEFTVDPPADLAAPPPGELRFERMEWVR